MGTPEKTDRWIAKESAADKEARAWAQALLFRPRTHDDDRRRGTFDVFHTPLGDINYSFIYPGTTVAWHRHRRQTDYWHVIRGALKVGLYDEERRGLAWVYLHEGERLTLAVPPGIWHGYRNLWPGETILSYYISEKYNQEDPDEERAPVGAFGESWETEAK